MLKITKSLIEKGDRAWARVSAQAAREKMRFKRLKTSI